MLLRLEVQHAQLVDYSIALGHGSCAYCDLLWSCQDLNREHRWKNRLMGRPFQPRKMPTSDAAIVNSAPGHERGRERAGFQRSAEVPTFTHDLVRSTDCMGNSFL